MDPVISKFILGREPLSACHLSVKQLCSFLLPAGQGLLILASVILNYRREETKHLRALLPFNSLRQICPLPNRIFKSLCDKELLTQASELC